MSNKVTSWFALLSMLILAGALTLQWLERMHYEDGNAPNVTVWSK